MLGCKSSNIYFFAKMEINFKKKKNRETIKSLCKNSENLII